MVHGHHHHQAACLGRTIEISARGFHLQTLKAGIAGLKSI